MKVITKLKEVPIGKTFHRLEKEMDSVVNFLGSLYEKFKAEARKEK